MNSNKIFIKTNHSIATNIKTHLLVCDSSFRPALSSYVDINDYSKKIFNKATREEAWQKENLIGLVAFYNNDESKKAFISNVSILPDYQGKRIANVLMQRTINSCFQMGAKEIRLEVYEENQSAYSLYIHFGFKQISIKENKITLKLKLNDRNKAVVSVCCLTYNHAPYIQDALNGFINQKTNFPFEVLIHDDASTDGTVDIIKEYAEKYPDIIKPIYQQDNQYSKGVGITFTYQFPRAQGRYIANCEGDDYWVDPLKLQKQFDHLEKQRSVSGCFNNALVVDKYGKKIANEWYDASKQKRDKFKKRFNQEYCLTTLRSSYPTCGLMFRSFISRNLPNWFKETSSDYSLDLLITEYGDLEYLPFIGSAYRIHDYGAWQGKNIIERQILQLQRYLVLYSSKYLRNKYSDYIKNEILNYSLNISKEYAKSLNIKNFTYYIFLYLSYKFFK